MEQFINFITQHYLLFDIITLFLILALIGYFVNIKKEKNKVFKINNSESAQNAIPPKQRRQGVRLFAPSG